jgi:hypothetical protein
MVREEMHHMENKRDEECLEHDAVTIFSIQEAAL